MWQIRISFYIFVIQLQSLLSIGKVIHALKNDIFNITRILNSGDVFYNSANVTECRPKICYNYQASPIQSSPCQCQCPSGKPVFFQNLGRCSDTVDNCRKINFISSNEAQQDFNLSIPTFFLPLSNEILNTHWVPNWKGIGVNNDTQGFVPCKVSGMAFLTSDGWFETPSLFSLLNINGYTYLKWMGTRQDQFRLTGKVLQVFVHCETLSNLCLVFRIVGVDTTGVPSTSSLSIVNKMSNEKLNQLGLIVGTVCGISLTITLLGGTLFWLISWHRQKKSEKRKAYLRLMKQQKLQTEDANRVNEFFDEFFCQPHNDALHRERRRISAHPFSEPSVWPREEIKNNHFYNYHYHYREPLLDPIFLNKDSKRKLCFNKAFFKPEFVNDPPESAEQFLFDMRQMMYSAKARNRIKKYKPRLSTINEETENSSIASTGSLDVKDKFISNATVEEQLLTTSCDSSSTCISENSSNGSRNILEATVGHSSDSGLETDNTNESMDYSSSVQNWSDKLSDSVKSKELSVGRLRTRSNLFWQFYVRQNFVQRQFDDERMSHCKFDEVNNEEAREFASAEANGGNFIEHTNEPGYVPHVCDCNNKFTSQDLTTDDTSDGFYLQSWQPVTSWLPRSRRKIISKKFENDEQFAKGTKKSKIVTTCLPLTNEVFLV